MWRTTLLRLTGAARHCDRRAKQMPLSSCRSGSCAPLMSLHLPEAAPRTVPLGCIRLTAKKPAFQLLSALFAYAATMLMTFEEVRVKIPPALLANPLGAAEQSFTFPTKRPFVRATVLQLLKCVIPPNTARCLPADDGRLAASPPRLPISGSKTPPRVESHPSQQLLRFRISSMQLGCWHATLPCAKRSIITPVARAFRMAGQYQKPPLPGLSKQLQILLGSSGPAICLSPR